MMKVVNLAQGRYFIRLCCQKLNNGYVHQRYETVHRKIWLFPRSYKRLPFEINTNVQRDTLIYNKSSGALMMGYLSFFGAAQTIVTSGLFMYILFCVRDPDPDVDERRWWKNNPFWRNKNKIALLGLCAVAGIGLGFICYQYPTHSLREIWLLKGGNHVRFHTYGPFNTTRKMTVPIKNISCSVLTRTDANKDVTLKVKGSKLHYIVDNKGTFPLPHLFDQTVGIKRPDYWK